MQSWTCKHKYSKHWTIGVKMLLCFSFLQRLVWGQRAKCGFTFQCLSNPICPLYVFLGVCLFLFFSLGICPANSSATSHVTRASPARYDWTAENNRPEGGSAYTLAGNLQVLQLGWKKISQWDCPARNLELQNGVALQVSCGLLNWQVILTDMPF